MRFSLALFALTLPTTIALGASNEEVSTFSLPDFDTSGKTELSLWATYYLLPQMNSSSGGHSLRATDGSAFPVKLDHHDYCVAAMEGSVRVRSESTNTVYNWAGKSPDGGPDCSDVYSRFPNIGAIRWRKAHGPFGDGADRGNGQLPWILVPFRSIAVDPNVIPFETTIFIPAARGVRMTLPDGRSVVHDGYFVATDRGGGIKENHIDVFIGTAASNPFKFIKSSQSGTFSAYVVKDTAIQKALKEVSIAK